MMLNTIMEYLVKPALYEESGDPFWDDAHISKGMLDAHLNPRRDAATRRMEFVKMSADWIAAVSPPHPGSSLLDLGCGPGIYAELFNQKGYLVTGVDFSKRSINYAKEQAALSGSRIAYHYQNYLEIDYAQAFNAVTLIYCDFGVLSAKNRQILLKKILKALKPGGTFIFDVFTPKQYENKPESTSWKYYADGGFWSAQPHLCLDALYRYDRENTFLNQTIIVTDQRARCYNIWEHCFTEESLLEELHAAGFAQCELFGDVAGSKYERGGTVICAAATKTDA